MPGGLKTPSHIMSQRCCFPLLFLSQGQRGSRQTAEETLGPSRASLGECGGSYARAGRRSQVAASTWQGLSSFSLARSHYLSEGCNAGRKFFKRLNYYCFLCGCLHWSMKKALGVLEKRFVWMARLLGFIPLPPGGIWPISSGKWLIGARGFIRGLNVRCHRGD